VPVVAAVNVFPADGAGEIEAVREAALAAGAGAAVAARHFAEGGAGALDLARAVEESAREGAPGFRLLYPDEAGLAEKIEIVATRVYGAARLELSRTAAAEIEELERLGYGRLPVCVAKTHLSLSHDPLLGPSPRGFVFPVREVQVAAGAGFVTALAGDIQLLPGLPARPAAGEIDVDAEGRPTGLH
jgi:formate--tetrahydrofolate ligase